MSKSELQVFRENINKFIEQLSHVYPNDKDLVIYRDKVVLYGKVDPRGMVEYFMHNIGRFTKHIMEKVQIIKMLLLLKPLPRVLEIIPVVHLLRMSFRT